MAINIELFRPSFGEEEIEDVKDTIKSKWWGLGPKTAKFEMEFAKYLGIKHAVAVNSCTAALQLAINCLDLPKDYVFIVPAISFIATAFAPMYEGHRVVFADVDPKDLMLNLDTIENAIDFYKLDREKVAIIPVHLYGNITNDIQDIVEDFKYVIEDCAHAAGSSYLDKKSGTFGTSGCFSFHAVKNLATADGGMVITDDNDYASRLKARRWFGINKSTFDRSNEDHLKKSYGWEYDIKEFGFKLHMNDLNAGLGSIQLGRLEEGNDRRREIAQTYSQELADEAWLELPTVNEGVISAQHIYAIRTKHRNDLNLYLKDKGVATGVHYKPMYQYGVFDNYAHVLTKSNIEIDRAGCAEHCKVAEAEWQKLLSLPCYPSLTEIEQCYVIDRIKEFGRKSC